MRIESALLTAADLSSAGRLHAEEKRWCEQGKKRYRQTDPGVEPPGVPWEASHVPHLGKFVRTNNEVGGLSRLTKILLLLLN